MVTEKSDELGGKQKLISHLVGKSMAGMFEVQRGENGELESRKVAYDQCTEYSGEVRDMRISEELDLMLPLLLVTEAHTPIGPAESPCTRPHSEFTHMILRTHLFVSPPVVGGKLKHGEIR